MIVNGTRLLVEINGTLSGEDVEINGSLSGGEHVNINGTRMPGEHVEINGTKLLGVKLAPTLVPSRNLKSSVGATHGAKVIDWGSNSARSRDQLVSHDVCD